MRFMYDIHVMGYITFSGLCFGHVLCYCGSYIYSCTSLGPSSPHYAAKTQQTQGVFLTVIISVSHCSVPISVLCPLCLPSHPAPPIQSYLDRHCATLNWKPIQIQAGTLIPLAQITHCRTGSAS